MKDSKGNEFGVHDKFKPSESPPGAKGDIKCISMGGDVARMEWLHQIGEQFNIDQKNLLTSHWVKVEP